ncbi:MAG TPA: NAD(+)/NADH kinase [Dehalococcoidia bacterium]|nr:NAD(+)/NADH kinase [Dehalococcoidia bacterium]
MNKVGIFVAARWRGATNLVESLRAALAPEVAEVWQTSSWDEPEAQERIEGTDLIICLGGDGSMLWAARAVVPHAVPILGVNMGRLGFLAEIGPQELMAELPRVLTGAGRVEQRAMLQARVPAWGQTFQALNDVVIGRALAGRPVYVDVSVDGQRLAIYRCDAVIVATGTGSTGYSLSAGGPVLHPESRDLLLTPVAPHLAPALPIVLPGDAVVDLIVSTEDGAAVSIDGQVNRTLDSGDGVSVCRSPHVARFLRLSRPQDYYRILAERLQLLKGINASEYPPTFEEKAGPK